jgi:glutaredoxin 3
MSKVTIYTSAFCPYCHRAKDLLRAKGCSFDEIDVTMHPGVRAEMRQKAGGCNSVPQIWIGEKHIGGCDALHELDAKGGLDPLLSR